MHIIITFVILNKMTGLVAALAVPDFDPSKDLFHRVFHIFGYISNSRAPQPL